MPEKPNIIVTFYSNCRIEPVDISGLFTGIFNSSCENRIYEVHESILEAVPTGEPEHPFEFIPVEEKTFTEERCAKYVEVKIQVVASGGSWAFKIHMAGDTWESSPVPYNATPAELDAAVKVGFQNKDPIQVARRSVIGGGGTDEYGPEDWVHFVEYGPGSWGCRIFVNGGLSGESGISFLGIDLGLGAVIEMVHKHDEKTYFVPIERAFRVGAKVPPASVEPHGGAGGSRASPHSVSGSRA